MKKLFAVILLAAALILSPVGDFIFLDDSQILLKQKNTNQVKKDLLITIILMSKTISLTLQHQIRLLQLQLNRVEGLCLVD